MPTYNTPPSSLEEIEGSGEVTYGRDGITGARKARVLTSEVSSAILYLMGGILQTTKNEIVYTPQTWPGNPLLVVDSIRTTPWGRSGLSSWSSAVLPHQYTKLEIEYRTNQFQRNDNDKEVPENEDYLIQEVDCSCDTLIVPVKVTDTNASAETTVKEVKQYIRLPKIVFNVTIPKVRFPKFNIIFDLNGKINTATVFNGAPGTVLFDGPKLSNTISSQNDPAWKFDMSFIYNRFGWNKTLHPETLKWVDANALDGGTSKMYEEGDLRRLWTREEE